MADANVLRTIFTYSLNGLGPYPIAFDYLARKFVQVTLLGADRKLLVLGTDYRFVSTTSIQLLKAAPAGYNQIEVRRYTSAQDRLVDFQDGSILRATDLNVSQVQTMHIAEEGRDVAGNTLGVDSGGNLDARLRRMVNLLDGVQDGDAVTIRQMKSWSESALHQADRAKAQADASAASASDASASAASASGSQVSSKSSEDLAKKWAANPKGSLVDANNYSAMHYALTAGESASAASGFRTNAEAAASQAANSAGQAVSSATAAKNAESGAAVSADKAKTEADKLTNMNDFAAAINTVSATNHDVSMKSAVSAQSFAIEDASFSNVLWRTTSDSANGGALTITPSTNVTNKNAVVVGGWSVQGLVQHRGLRQELKVNNYTYQFNQYLQADAKSYNLELVRSGVVRAYFNINDENTFNFSGDIFARVITTRVSSPANPGNGAFLNTLGVRSQLQGRGAMQDANGAYCQMYMQEQVGTTHRLLLNLNGYGSDTNWQFSAGGKINTPQGEVQTTGSDVRIKKDIVPAQEGAGKRIDEVGLVEYTEIATGRRRRGWIAQQVDLVDPLYAFYGSATSMVEDEEITILNTDDRAMLADLIAEVQSLRKRVATLEAK